MNRIPVIGDVVSTGRHELVVIDTRIDRHEAGELSRTWGHHVAAIKLADMGKSNPKTVSMYIRLMGDPEPTDTQLKTLVFHEQIKLKTTVTYTEK